jgi:hypothetical protein
VPGSLRAGDTEIAWPVASSSGRLALSAHKPPPHRAGSTAVTQGFNMGGALAGARGWQVRRARRRAAGQPGIARWVGQRAPTGGGWGDGGAFAGGCVERRDGFGSLSRFARQPLYPQASTETLVSALPDLKRAFTSLCRSPVAREKPWPLGQPGGRGALRPSPETAQALDAAARQAKTVGRRSPHTERSGRF